MAQHQHAYASYTSNITTNTTLWFSVLVCDVDVCAVFQMLGILRVF